LPCALILPMVALPPVMVLTSQNTEIGFPPESVAVQANAMPEVTVRPDGVVEPEQSIALMAVAALIVTLAVAVRLVWAWAIAVMVTMLLVGTVCGAVYFPFVSIVPKVEFPPATPPASQLTSVLLRFVILAVHCVCPFTVSVEEAQEAVIVGVVVVVLELPPPQEFRANTAGRSAKTRSRRCHLAFWRQMEPFG